ncbi:hypothetical protein NIES4073_16780 [Kalymmatonema gypsitolerans NIES-4073]|nr:hypothetical protein NIES4073_16780 [Scytonema sp. NIES-4073]
MAYFSSICGRLEVELQDFASVIDIVKSLQASYPVQHFLASEGLTKSCKFASHILI